MADLSALLIGLVTGFLLNHVFPPIWCFICKVLKRGYESVKKYKGLLIESFKLKLNDLFKLVSISYDAKKSFDHGLVWTKYENVRPGIVGNTTYISGDYVGLCFRTKTATEITNVDIDFESVPHYNIAPIKKAIKDEQQKHIDRIILCHVNDIHRIRYFTKIEITIKYEGVLNDIKYHTLKLERNTLDNLNDNFCRYAIQEARPEN